MAIWKWADNHQDVISRLQHHARLKICCKTFNEPEFIAEWIEHHGAIVGFENLIIADNASTDPATQAVYERYSDRVTIFTFDGPHNEIHWHPRFSPLFDCIKTTADFFSFLDVDERLVHVSDDTWSADGRLLDLLADATLIYPATWLINALGERDTFTLSDTEGRPNLLNNLKWGKPIFPSGLTAAQHGIHNFQFLGHPFAETAGTRLMLWHLTEFPEQRIRANINKLYRRNLVDLSASPEDVIRADFSDFPDTTVLRFQREINKMWGIMNGRNAISGGAGGRVYFLKGGELRFSDETTQASFQGFLAGGNDLVRTTFAQTA